MYPRRATDCDLQDGGRNAWTVLAAVSTTNIVTYGFSTSFGVFREYYFQTPPLVGIYEVAYAGLISLGLMQSLAPVFIYFLGRYPNQVKPLMWLGALMMVASVIGAAFVSTAAQLILTLGVVQGIGGGCVFAPCLIFIDEWFVKRRTLANGIFFSMASLSPACLCPIFAYTLRTYSSRTTLLGWAVACAALSAVSLPFIRSRRPGPVVTVDSAFSTSSASSSTSTLVSEPDAAFTRERLEKSYDSSDRRVLIPPPSRRATTPTHLSPPTSSTLRGPRFYNLPIFYLLVLTTLLHNTVYFLPSLYIPSYYSSFLTGSSLLQSSDQDQLRASLLVTAFQLACIVAQPSYGEMVDRIGPLVPLVLATLGGAMAVLVVWGLAGGRYAVVAVFMVLFGATSGGFVVLRSSFATCVIRVQQQKARGSKVQVWTPDVARSESSSTLISSGSEYGHGDLDKQHRISTVSVAAEGALSEAEKEAIRKEESLISGLLMSIRGIATVVSGLIGKAIVQGSSQTSQITGVNDEIGYAGGERWRPLVLFVGIMLAVASLGTVGLARVRVTLNTRLSRLTGTGRRQVGRLARS